MLCAGRVPVVPIHTTAAMCGTAVRSSLGSAGPPQWSNNSSIRFKCLLLSPVSSCCSRQMQGVMGVALNRWRELRVRCTASASRSSTEAASSVLSTSPESWIARVGRANSSTRQYSHHLSQSQTGGYFLPNFDKSFELHPTQIAHFPPESSSLHRSV